MYFNRFNVDCGIYECKALLVNTAELVDEPISIFILTY